MKRSELKALFIIIISFLIAIYFYPQMPDKIAGHWNIRGQVNGFLPKFWGLFLMPGLSVVLFILFLIIPKLDPLAQNIKKFRSYFDNFVLLIILFLFYIYLLTIFWNFGYRFNFGQLLTPAFGLLIYYCGVLFEHSKKNWFIGIRTPWTLSSDKVWDKTHQLGAKLFKICGVISFLGILLPQVAFYLVIVPIILASIYTYAYSYFEYKRKSSK